MSLIRRGLDWLVGSGFSFRNGGFHRNWGYPMSEGITVTEETALRTIAVLRAVNIIAGANASLPFDVYRRLPGGRRQKAESHPVERLFDVEPNPEMSSMDLRHFCWTSLQLWGNSYCKIVWREASRKTPVALWPLYPGGVEVKRRGDDPRGDIFYRYTVDGKQEDYDSRDVWHCRLLSLDGVIGLSPIGMARAGVAMNQITARYARDYFRKGQAQRLGISFERGVTPDERKHLHDDWETNNAGENAGRPVISGGGAKFSNIGIPLRDQQFIELMQANDEQIAMLFGVPPHMMGIVSKTTSWGTGIGEQKQGFLDFTLAPQLTFFEKSIERSLVKDDAVYVKHNTGAFLRANIKERMEALAMMRDRGVLNGDEWRAYEDLEPMPGGDAFLVNSTMIPLDMAGKMKATEPKPAPKEAA